MSDHYDEDIGSYDNRREDDEDGEVRDDDLDDEENDVKQNIDNIDTSEEEEEDEEEIERVSFSGAFFNDTLKINILRCGEVSS